MQATICDICKENLACQKIKIKLSRNQRWIDASCWSPWQKIDVCEDCGENILKSLNNSTKYLKSPVIQSENRS